MQIKFVKLNKNAFVPTRATPGAAGYDLHAIENGFATTGSVVKIPLGIAVELPPSTAMLITARSGHGLRYGAGVPHGYGLIDSDYRGELCMVLVTETNMAWCAGDRIGQAIIVAVPHYEFVEAQSLSETARGIGGFGSTGGFASQQAIDRAIAGDFYKGVK